MTTTTPTSGAADLRATFSEMLVDLPNTEPYTLFKAGFDAALAAGQADSVQEDAARYRDFRDCSVDDRNRLEHYSGPALDVAVDTFNAARKQGGAT